MPRGRFISRSISTNEQLAGVSFAADFLFTRCIAHLDAHGRMTGNPILIKSEVVPLREEITVRSIPKLLNELANAKDHTGQPLVVWYEAAGQKVLAFPGFERQQQGLRTDREAPSRFPAQPVANPTKSNGAHPEALPSNAGPSPDQLPLDSGVIPELVPPKRSEGKRSEEKVSEVKDSRRKPRDEHANGAEPPADRPSAATWLTPIRDAWEAAAGAGSFGNQFGQAAKWLDPIRKAGTDPPTIAAHLTSYLEQTNAEFWSIATFAKSFEKWKPQPLVDEFGILTAYGERITRP